MPIFLVPVESGQNLIPLEKAIVLIGRQADCDVYLSNSRKISRRHCCVAQVNDRFVVRDLGSTNGVFLNGRRIEKEADIVIGDDLIIGDVHFKMLSEIPPSANSSQSKAGKFPVSPIPGYPQGISKVRASGTTQIEKVDDETEDDSNATSRSSGVRKNSHRSRSNN